MNKSITIIGGGLGGLICGAILSKEGYGVTILERHYVAGGGLHLFYRGGIPFETGLHYIGGLESGGMLRKLFTYLGIMDSLHYRDMDIASFDRVLIMSDHKEYYMGRGKENFVEVLSKQFPGEESAIRGYIDAIYNICEQIPFNNLKLPDQSLLLHTFGGEDVSVDEFIATYTSNKELQSVLAWNSTLYSGRSHKTPLFVAALITKMYIEGAARMIGGGGQIADALCKVIRDNGGEVLVNKEVTHISVEDKRVTNVFTSDGSSYQSDIYISSIDPRHIVKIADTHSFSKAFRDRVNSIESSDSMFTLFILFRPESFKYLNYNVFVYDDYSDVLRGDYQMCDFPRQMVAMTPPRSSNDLYAEKMIVHCAMKYETVSQWSNTKVGHRGADYLEFKERCSRSILAKLTQIFPGIEECIDNYFSASPLTIRDYLGSSEGSAYGRVFDCKNYEKSYLSPTTKINNLYLTGQNVRLHGICGVPMTALETCSCIIGMQQLINKINNSNNI